MRRKLQTFQVVFWDFDGVIKDSVSAKTKAFRKLFAPYGTEVQELVQKHHEANGGVSRFEKIPYYFKEYIGRTLTNEEEVRWCQRFSHEVLDKVCLSPWVPGVLEYLQINCKKQLFYLVTATPQEEIEIILERLKLKDFFNGVYGVHRKKGCILKELLEKNAYSPSDCVMIGDSMTDYKAAKENGVHFILRETDENCFIFEEFSCDKLIL